MIPTFDNRAKAPITNAGSAIKPATINPKYTTLSSSALANPPPTKPATNGLTGIVKKCTIGIGIDISIIENIKIDSLFNLDVNEEDVIKYDFR